MIIRRDAQQTECESIEGGVLRGFIQGWAFEYSGNVVSIVTLLHCPQLKGVLLNHKMLSHSIGVVAVYRECCALVTHIEDTFDEDIYALCEGDKDYKFLHKGLGFKHVASIEDNKVMKLWKHSAQ